MTTPIYSIFQWFTQISHMQLIAVLIIFLMSQGNEYRFLPQDVWWNREAVAPKLTQISRISEKSLLCNVSMNTCLDDWASLVGSAISVGTLPLRRTTQWCITPQNTWRKHQRVRKCPSKHLNPTWRRVREDTFIKHRNSKAIRLFEIRKWQDNFSIIVHGYSIISRKNQIHSCQT